jgi:hypothetical protein
MLDFSAEIKSAFEKGEFFTRQISGCFNRLITDISMKFKQRIPER